MDASKRAKTRRGVNAPIPRSAELLDWLLETLYPIPAPHVNEEEHLRFMHADLPLLTLGELRRERRRLHLRMALEASPSYWLRERLRATRKEVMRRG